MLHRAKVVDNRPTDPQWRMTVQVPGLYSDSPVEAWPMLVSNTLQERPDIGAGVWVMEADGDMVVWMGQWATAGMDVDALLNQGHEQFLTNATHDITARHTFGAALGTPAAGADIATAGAAGSGASPSRSDHTHKVGTGAINNSAMFAAGVVNTAALANAGAGAAGPIGAASTSAIITVDAKGRVTNLTSAAITPAAIGAPSGSGTHSGTSSGTNTGDQSFSLGGAVSGSGLGTITTTLNPSAVLNKIQSVSGTLSGRSGGVVGTSTQLYLQGGTFVGSTDGSGNASISFASAYAGLVACVAVNGDSNVSPYFTVAVSSPGTSGCTFKCFNTSGSAVASTSVRIDWLALGW